jgi:hypothetical protein
VDGSLLGSQRSQALYPADTVLRYCNRMAALTRREWQKIMTLKQKAEIMRNAIDAIKLAMQGWPELLELPDNCALDESDADDLELEVKITWKHLRQVLSAVDECNRIMNSDEFVL